MKSFPWTARLVAAVTALGAVVAACGGKAVVDQTTGSGGSGATTTTTSTTTTTGNGGGVPSNCDGLGQTECLAAFPGCVPIYDDACCPTCDPGPCADCVNWQFYACVPAASACAPASPSCGQTPPWACSGGSAQCPSGFCQGTIGCVAATCPIGVGCIEQCHPVSAGMCSVTCLADPPECPPGTVPEADGLCYTGLCIPADVCP